jgi:hypothetical protein
MRSLVISSAALALALTAGACARQDDTAAPPEPATASAPQPSNRPMTVAGCLRPGDAANTFVLTATGAVGTEPATYELVSTSADLRPHIGRRVEVSGTLASEQDVRTPTTAAEQDKAKGTTGTPVVETRNKIEIRRMEVASVRPVEGDCK